MNKTFLIIRHEFGNLIKRKGFLIFTLLFPLIGFVALGVYQLVEATGSQDTGELHAIGYIDEPGEFVDYTVQGNFTFKQYDTVEKATTALLAGDIEEYFVIPSGYMENGLIPRYLLEKELEVPGETQVAMREFLLSNLLEGETGPELTDRVKAPLWLQNIRLDEEGNIAVDQGGFEAFFVPVIFGFLLVMAIGMTSGYLLQGLGEEKENRVMEVLLSSVSTRELLAGKVLGLGAAGLLQVIVWLVSIILLVRSSSSIVGGFFTNIQIPDNMLVLGIIYFLLAYLLFAILQAGAGAIGASAKESQQMSVFFILPSILPFYIFIFFLRDNPEHVVSHVLTLFPLTAPMSVFLRLGLSEIPPWELAVSICLMVLAIIGSLWLVAKIFRVFLLMYGKTPRLGEIARYLREG